MTTDRVWQNATVDDAGNIVMSGTLTKKDSQGNTIFSVTDAGSSFNSGLVVSGIQDVMAFGAHNDGTHAAETHAAFVAAITAAHEASTYYPGGVVHVPKGLYLLNSSATPLTVPDGVTIIGDGPGESGTFNQGATVIDGNSLAYAFITVGGDTVTKRIGVKNLTIKNTSSGAIFFDHVYRCNIEDVEVLNVTGSGAKVGIFVGCVAPDLTHFSTDVTIKRVTIAGLNGHSGSIGLKCNASICHYEMCNISNNSTNIHISGGTDHVLIADRVEGGGLAWESVAVRITGASVTCIGNHPESTDVGFFIEPDGVGNEPVVHLINNFPGGGLTGTHIRDNTAYHNITTLELFAGTEAHSFVDRTVAGSTPIVPVGCPDISQLGSRFGSLYAKTNPGGGVAYTELSSDYPVGGIRVVVPLKIASTFTSLNQLGFTLDGATTTPDNALLLQNTTVSTALATVHDSPTEEMWGTAWDSTAGATKKTGIRTRVVPVSSAGNVFSRFQIDRQTENGGWVDVATISEGRNGADVPTTYSLKFGGTQAIALDAAGNTYLGNTGVGLYVASTGMRVDSTSLAFFGGTQHSQQSITGALSAVVDPAVKNLLTGIIGVLGGTSGQNLADISGVT